MNEYVIVRDLGCGSSAEVKLCQLRIPPDRTGAISLALGKQQSFASVTGTDVTGSKGGGGGDSGRDGRRRRHRRGSSGAAVKVHGSWWAKKRGEKKDQLEGGGGGEALAMTYMCVGEKFVGAKNRRVLLLYTSSSLTFHVQHIQLQALPVRKKMYKTINRKSP